MNKIIRLTESDLTRIVKMVINEEGKKKDKEESKEPSLDPRLTSAYKKWIKTEDPEYFGGDKDSDTAMKSFLKVLESFEYKVRGKLLNRLEKKYGEMPNRVGGRLRSTYKANKEKTEKMSKSEILKMSKEELADVYGILEVKGEYNGNKGKFHHFKKTSVGDVVCSFRTDDTTPSGLKRNTQSIKVKSDDVKFD